VKTKVKDAEAKRKFSACEYGVKRRRGKWCEKWCENQGVKLEKIPPIFFLPTVESLEFLSAFYCLSELLCRGFTFRTSHHFFTPFVLGVFTPYMGTARRRFIIIIIILFKYIKKRKKYIKNGARRADLYGVKIWCERARHMKKGKFDKVYRQTSSLYRIQYLARHCRWALVQTCAFCPRR